MSAHVSRQRNVSAVVLTAMIHFLSCVVAVVVASKRRFESVAAASLSVLPLVMVNPARCEPGRRWPRQEDRHAA